MKRSLQTFTYTLAGFGDTGHVSGEIDTLVGHLPDCLIQSGRITWVTESTYPAPHAASFFQIKLYQQDDRGKTQHVGQTTPVMGPQPPKSVDLHLRRGFPFYMRPVLLRVARQVPTGLNPNWEGLGNLVLTLHLDEGNTDYAGVQTGHARPEAESGRWPGLAPGPWGGAMESPGRQP